MLIKELLKDYNIEFWDSGKNVTPGWVNISCPFCNDTSNHGGFNPIKDYYNCWHCGWHRIEKVIAIILGITEYKAKAIIQNYKTEFIKKEESRLTPTSISLPGKEPQLQHIKYLMKRGFEPLPLITKYQLLGTLYESRDYGYRIIIPILYKGKVVSFQSRSIAGNVDQRYKACAKEKEIIEHKKILYNLDNCNKKKVIVVEGVIDCWKLGNDCCCTFGVDYTKEQFLMLLQFEEVFICFDPDEPGQTAAIKLSNELGMLNKKVEIIKLETDPGDLSLADGLYLKKELLGE
jgi:hypothetical protein